jgi:hypothetical protein
MKAHPRACSKAHFKARSEACSKAPRRAHFRAHFIASFIARFKARSKAHVKGLLKAPFKARFKACFMASSKACSKAAREATPTLGFQAIDYRPTPRQYERYALMSALAKSPLCVLAFGLQIATWKLVARGDVAHNSGWTNSLIAGRLALSHFFFDTVYRIAGPVLAP